MKTLTFIFLLLTGIAQGQIDTIVVDSTPHTMYAVVSVSEYYNFNADISVRKGYKLEDKTARVYSMNPQRYAFTEDSTALNVVIAVNPENQLYCDYPLIDINEVPSPVDTVLEDIEVELIDQKTFDWMAKHYDKVGDKSKKWIWINGKIDKEKEPKEIKDKVK